MQKKYRPESLMMSYGYRPEWSEGSVKCPIFQTSTFSFSSAEQGKAYFELAYGLREGEAGEKPGLIYSRLNNPDLQILEERLCLWDKAEESAVFESGMSAISTVLYEFVKPGQALLYSNPVYGGTAHFITEVLAPMGVEVIPFLPGEAAGKIADRVRDRGCEDKLAMIYVETPANPTNALIDLRAMKRLAQTFSDADREVLLAVDNTYMGPLWQHPFEHGADLVIYSATKYLGGHSDLIAGAVLGSEELMHRVKTLRTFLGNMAGPWTCWLLMRSLETLKVRLDQQLANARVLAGWLADHPAVERVYYPELLCASNEDYRTIYENQCLAPGAMIAFELSGGEAEAFAFLNHLKLVKLAVSLGSTESLAQHPASMTHAGLPTEHKEILGITPNLVRLSVGIEYVEDLQGDLEQALAAVGELVA